MAPADPRPPRLAGGLFIAVAVLAGALIGAGQGQPTIGLLVGLAAGIALALLVWLADRSRR